MSIAEMLNKAAPIVPVVVIENVEHALPLAEALLQGGVHSIEITLRTDAALDAIRALAKADTGIIIGAGTVLNATQWQQAADAGAHFAVSPGLCASLEKQNINAPIPLLPGAVTASEIQRALEAGFEFLKFFPAASSGGADAVKSFASPFKQVKFCPTGGISVETATAYLNLPNVVCVGGSWLTPASLLREQRWSAISDLAKQASSLGKKA